jgi:hypothetical protein
VVGGCCPPILRDRAGASCPLGPPLHRSSVEPPVIVVRSLDLFLVDAHCSPPPCSVFFPTGWAGASIPGDGCISYGTGKPGTARSTAAKRRGSSVETQSFAASPRPRHRGDLLVGQPASCSSPEVVGLVSPQMPMAAAAVSRTLLHSVRDLPPPPSTTVLPCGPRSAELLVAPLPFLRFCPVRPGGVYKSNGGGCCNARSPLRSVAAATAPPAWPPA